MSAKTTAEWVATFFLLVADGGQFRECQLHEYVSRMERRSLSDREKLQVTAIAESAGAKRDKKDAKMFSVNPKRRRALPKGKNDRVSLNMFGGK